MLHFPKSLAMAVWDAVWLVHGCPHVQQYCCERPLAHICPPESPPLMVLLPVMAKASTGNTQVPWGLVIPMDWKDGTCQYPMALKLHPERQRQAPLCSQSTRMSIS